MLASVVLEVADDDQTHIFYCPDCRAPVFKYKGEVAMLIPGNPPGVVFKVHLEARCPNQFCKKNYRLISIVKSEP